MPVILLLLVFASCSSGESRDEKAAEGAKKAEAEEAVAGSFVGEVSGANAFVAVVAGPGTGGKDSRAVQVYVSDGRRLSEWFSGSSSDNRFVAKSGDGSREASGELSGDSATGTVELPGGKKLAYEAGAPSGAAGLYELTVSADGNLSGASAAGLGVTGEIRLRRRGTGMLRLADGERVEFDVTPGPAGGPVRLRGGQVRLIVLSGRLLGAGQGRPTAGGDAANFFIRSA